MNVQRLVDFSLSDDGDFLVEDGDFALSFGLHALKDTVTMRILTQKPEWVFDSSYGSTLEDLIGAPNTHETAQKGVDSIIHALTYDGLIPREDVEVIDIPYEHEIEFHVLVTVEGASGFHLKFTLDMNDGIRLTEAS